MPIRMTRTHKTKGNSCKLFCDLHACTVGHAHTATHTVTHTVEHIHTNLCKNKSINTADKELRTLSKACCKGCKCFVADWQRTRLQDPQYMILGRASHLSPDISQNFKQLLTVFTVKICQLPASLGSRLSLINSRAAASPRIHLVILFRSISNH